jgi:hypothetical protein
VWSFLQGVKVSGSPLPRAALVQRALKDASLLEVLSQYVQSALDSAVLSCSDKVVPRYASPTHSLNGANKILSFYTATVIEMAEERPFDDTRMRHIYLFLVEGLKNKHKLHAHGSSAEGSTGTGTGGASLEVDLLDQWRRSCCMILVQLSVRTSMGKAFVKVISAALAESFKRCAVAAAAATAAANTGGSSGSSVAAAAAAVLEVASSMTILAQQHKLKIDSKVLQCVMTQINVVPAGAGAGAARAVAAAATPESQVFALLLRSLEGLRGNYNTAPIAQMLCSALANELAPVREDGPAKEVVLSAPVLSWCLCHVLSSKLVEPSTVCMVLKIVLNAVKKFPASEKLAKEASAALQEVVRCVAQRHALEFEATLQEVLGTAAAAGATASGALEGGAVPATAAATATDNAVLTAFLGDAFSAVEQKHHLPGTEGAGLYLSLTSVIVPIRVQALSAFAAQVPLHAASSADIVGLAYAVSQCLLDSVPEVALAAWTSPVVLRVLQHVSGAEALDLCQGALRFWSNASARSGPVACKVLEALLLVLQDGAVLEVLVKINDPASSPSSAGASTSTSTGVQWLFATLVPVALGSIANNESLVRGAVKALKAASAIHKDLSMFSTLSPSSSLTKEVATKAVISAVAASGASSSPLLRAVAAACYRDIIEAQYTGASVAAVKILRVLVAQAAEFDKAAAAAAAAASGSAPGAPSSASKKAASASAATATAASAATHQQRLQYSVETACPLALLALGTLTSSLARDPAAKELTAALEVFAEVVGHTAASVSVQASASVPTAATKVGQLTAPLLFSNVASRMLVKVLSVSADNSSASAVAGLLRSCLQHFSSAAVPSWELLLQVVLNSSRSTQQARSSSLPAHADVVYAEDSEAAVAAAAGVTVRIDEGASRTAMQLMCTYMSGIAASVTQGSSSSSSKNKGAKGGALSASDSTFLLLLLPVVVQLCSHNDAAMRTVGLTLAARMGAVTGELTLAPVHFQPHSALSGSAPSVSDVQAVCAVLQSRAAIVAVEPFAAVSALAQEVFEVEGEGQSGGDKNRPHSRRLAALLCALASEFGWTLPVYASPIFSAAKSADFAVTWPFLLHVTQSAQGSEAGCEQLAATLISCIKLGYAAGGDAAVSDAVLQWVVRQVSAAAAAAAGAPVSASSVAVKQGAMQLIEEGAFASVSAEQRGVLYRALLSEQMDRPGQKIVIGALQHLQVDPSLPASMLFAELDTFTTLFAQLSATADAARSRANSSAASEMEVEELDEEDLQQSSGLLSGLSAPLQRVLSLLETLSPVLLAAADAGVAQYRVLLGEIAAALCDMLALLQDHRLRSVMLVDYCKALVLETAHTALTVAGSEVLPASVGAASSGATASAKKPAAAASKRKSVSGPAASEDGKQYTAARVVGDVKLLLECITFTKATQVQSAALKLLKVLLKFNPASVMGAMQALGQLLATSSSSANMQVGKEGLIEQILKTFVSFLPAAGSAVTTTTTTTTTSSSSSVSSNLMPQQMLQALCGHFHHMPHHRRAALMKMALTVMPASSALTVAVNVLLVHCFAAHEADSAANAGSISASVSTGSSASTSSAARDVGEFERAAAEAGGADSSSGSSSNSATMILLSKSAHRRAHRELKSSVPEELFALCTSLMLGRSPTVQMGVIIQLLNSAHQFLEGAIANAGSSSSNGGDEEDGGLNTQESLDYCATLLQNAVADSAVVAAAVGKKNSSASLGSSSSGSGGADSRRGNAATIAILHLELIVEILENKTFHEQLVAILDGGSNSSSKSAAGGGNSNSSEVVVQEHFMSFADSVLQLLAMTSAVEQGYGLEVRQRHPLKLRIEGTALSLSPRALGKFVSGWCYEALGTMQKLMDGPTFVAIIQELIDHEQLEVRQKALVILGERLEAMNTTKLNSEAEVRFPAFLFQLLHTL